MRSEITIRFRAGTRRQAVIGRDHTDSAVYRRIARRVEDILEAAKERERKGQTLALDIDARFRLQDVGAVQFQLASAILEEVSGLRQEEVVTELLTLGLASVLQGAAKAASQNGVSAPLEPELVEETLRAEEGWSDALTAPSPLMFASRRVLN
jgi:hypothetical protein